MNDLGVLSLYQRLRETFEKNLVFVIFLKKILCFVREVEIFFPSFYLYAKKNW
jgi:hypothetical protein